MKKKMTLFMAAAMTMAMSVPAMAAPAKAELSSAKVAVNGAEIAPQAYTIDGYTYFKLRDVAKALAGTVAGFDVAWNQVEKMVALQTGTVYKYQDGEGDAAGEFAKTAEAHVSTDPIMVNGVKADLSAYNIDGYNYFKLRDLGDALGFAVTWDNAAKMIGINADAVEANGVATEDSIEYTLEEGTAYVFENETFAEEVILNCPVAEAKAEYVGEFAQYEVAFKNCVFEKGLKIVSDKDTNVVIDEGCVFKNGTGVVVEEVTEGNHLTMDLYDDPFVRVRAYVEGVNVTTDDSAVVFGTATAPVALNGVVYTVDDFENPDGPYAEAFCVAQYFENGEAMLYLEGWGPTYEEIAAAEAEAARAELEAELEAALAELEELEAAMAELEEVEVTSEELAELEAAAAELEAAVAELEAALAE